jgi:hypothetical protein
VKFSTHAVIKGNPQFTLSAKPGPFKVEADAQASLKIATGEIDARLSRVPIAMRIPFLARPRSIQIGSVGPLRLRIRPIEVDINPVAVRVAGVIAKDGMACEVRGNVACDMEMDLTGSIPGRITKAAVELAAEPDAEE